MKPIKNWDVLDYADQVSQLCVPIQKHFNVTYFNYVRLNKDNSRHLLTDRPEWIDLFYREKFYNARTTLDIEALKYQQYFSWEKLKDEFTFQEAIKHNISNGVTLLEQTPDHLDLYWFGTDNNNHDPHLLENNIDALQRFTLYFKDKGAKLLRTVHQKPIVFNDYENETADIEFKTLDQFINTLVKSDKLRFTYEDAGEIRFLSKQETICASYLILQFSMREIAIYMQISARTVETYLNNIKIKLGCLSKSNLVNELLNLKIADVSSDDDNVLFYPYDLSQLLTLNDYITDTHFKRLYVHNGVEKKLYLTRKECELLFYFCSGLSPKNIAVRLACTVKTVEGYLDKLKKLLAAHKRSDLVSICVSSGLLYKIMVALPFLVTTLNQPVSHANVNLN
jgi:DNA-binding CsgD family transcriptional regulator